MTQFGGLMCTYRCSDWKFYGIRVQVTDCVCVLEFALCAYLYFHNIWTLLCFPACYSVPCSGLLRCRKSFSVLRNKRSINPGMMTSGTHRVCLCVCGSLSLACGFIVFISVTHRGLLLFAYAVTTNLFFIHNCGGLMMDQDATTTF